MIAAIAANNAIGFENKLLYRLPDDLKRFKALTTGHTVIMGRKTFESLPKGALPHRRNIVLSKNPTARYENTEVFHSLEEALRQCSETEEVFIIGGESLYREALSQAGRLYLTVIEDTPPHADAFFPAFEERDWELLHSEPHESDERHRQRFVFKDYQRKKENR